MAPIALKKPLLGLHEVSKGFGAQPVLADITFTVHEGDRIGLIGRNGSGKTTLLRVMAGELPPDTGLVTRKQGLRAGLLAQQTALEPAITLGQALEHAQEAVRARVERYHALLRGLDDASAQTRPVAHAERREFEALEHELEVTGAFDLEQDIKRICVALDLPGRDRLLGTLSGGEQRRAALAMTLVQRPDVLLLDEPTNHIDVDSIGWIERFLGDYRGSCVLVTHDRYFLERVVNRIVEIESAGLIHFPGSYDRFLEYKALRRAHDARAEMNRQALMRRELEWIRRGPKARRTKQKARITRFDAIEGEGSSSESAELQFAIPRPPRLGKRVIEAEGISRGYGDRVLFRDLSLIMQKDMRIGVVGPNGCGKTTLLRVLMGLDSPDAGTVSRSEAAAFLYVDQTHEEIKPNSTILQHVTDGVREIMVNGNRVFVPAYLESFLFDRDSVNMPMRNLSGGERNRLDLAKKLLRGGNVLVLDEPTNDLDLPTLRVLEEAVLAFDGCALIVSHDRFFLNRVCTHLLAFEGGGSVVQIAGNYDDYLIYRQRAKPAAEAARPSASPKALKSRTSAARPQTAPASPQTAPASPQTAPASPQTLTWKEKKELKGIEGEIQDAEADVRRLEGQVCAPGFYEQEYALVGATLASLEQAKTRAEKLYSRWLELTERSNG